MAGSAFSALRLACLAGVLLAAAAGGAPAQQRVGVSGAVNPQSTGTPPGAAARPLIIGQDVLYNERITTAASGQAQLLFLDESAMTVGPNSDLTIDQFVYNPKSGTGKLAMSATRGLLRYVGGKLSKHDGAVTLRTSTATLAVRGGVFIAQLAVGGGGDRFIWLFGIGATITGTNGKSLTLRRPGFAITVNSKGQLSAPAPVPATVLANLLQQLDGRSGGTGGATVIPTNATVEESGISQTISGDVAGSLQQAQQSLPPPPLPPDPAQITQTFVQQPPQGTSPTKSISVATTTTSPPVTIVYAGQVRYTDGQGARGFVELGGNGDVQYSGGTLSFPAGTPQSGVFTADVGGAVGTVSFPLVPGSAAFQGTSSSLGGLTGSSFLSADDTFFYASITPGSRPGERIFIFGGTPVSSSFYQPTGSTRTFAFALQPDAALRSTIPFVRGQAGGNLPGASVSPFYLVAPATTAIGDTSTNAGARGLQASLAISGQGANQQSSIAMTVGTIVSPNGLFSGGLRGSSLMSANGTPLAIDGTVSSTVDANGYSLYGGNAISGFVLDQSPSGASETPLSGTPTSYGFAQAALPEAVPAGVGTSRSTRALSGSFGGLMYTNAQGNPYIVTGATRINTDAGNNRLEATLAGQQPFSGGTPSPLPTLQYGSLTGAAGYQAFVDDNNFAAAESPSKAQQLTVNGTATQPTGQLYLVSSGAAGAPASLLPAGVSYCQCQYLQWGYWGGDLTTQNGLGPGMPRIDSGHINTWVAGVPTPLSDIASLQSQAATATYAGHAIGSVFNNGASYVAAGGFSGTYNFGTQSGTITVSNFDGHTFSASGNVPLSGNTYSFGGSANGVKVSGNGAFYGPQAAETGGSFAVQSTAGPTYLASGIYAGRKQ